MQEESREAVTEQGPYPQFLLFGDSLTQRSSSQDLGFGFMPALQNAFIRRLDIINRGFSGYNTAQAKAVLPRFIPTPEQASIEWMTLFFGANDACLESSPSKQHVPLADYSQNLRDIMTNRFIAAHEPRIILITPPPINEYKIEDGDRERGFVEASRTVEHTRAYATACRGIGEELDVPVLDLWSIMMAKAGWKEGDKLLGSRDAPRNEVLDNLLSDGLHFLPLAYKLLYESLMELIAEKWPDQIPERIPFRFPVWTDAPM